MKNATIYFFVFSGTAADLLFEQSGKVGKVLKTYSYCHLRNGHFSGIKIADSLIDTGMVDKVRNAHAHLFRKTSRQ